MASDSQTVTATIPEKVNEEAKLMEKEIVLQEPVDVVKDDEPVSDSNLMVTKEEQIDQTLAGEPKKETQVEEVASVVKPEKSTEIGKEESGEKNVLKEPTLVKESVEDVIVEDVIVESVEAEKEEEKRKYENGEELVDEQVEPKELTLSKDGVDEAKLETVDAEEAEQKGKDETGEEKVDEQVELKEPTLVKESGEEVKLETVVAEKAEEKKTMESVAEEDNKHKEEEKIVDVSESVDEAIGNQVEVVDVSAETAEDKSKGVEILEVKPKLEASEIVENQAMPEKSNEIAPEVEVVKAGETPETAETEQAKVETERALEESIVDAKVSGISLKDEKTSESVSPLSPEETVPAKQDSDISFPKETREDASPRVDVIEKAIIEETHLVDEPFKDKDENTSESASALCHEEVVPAKQDSETTLEKETKGDISTPADITEKAITEEKHVVEEPTKDHQQENISETKGVATEDESIKKDTEPAAEAKTKETLKEAETETEANKQEEPITEKVTEVVETEHAIKEQQEVTSKEVGVKQKQSNSIMSKLKQSLVKAKKAIIGKSPSSKTVSNEEATKGEIKV